MLFIPITLAAATFQVARNAAQRGLMGDAGPWGATLVRFLYGLPFTAVFLAIALAIAPPATLTPTPMFWVYAAVGGASQIGATASLLECMKRSGFAMGTTFQQSLLPFSAGIGAAFFGDIISLQAWFGILLAMTGVAVLSWPKEGLKGDWTGASLGLLAGLFFAVSNNGFRQAALSLGEAPPFVLGIATVLVVQFLQSSGLIVCLAVLNRPALKSAFASWRMSMRAGFFGAAASSCWFTALALSPAGPVRAVGVVEMPLAAMAGRKLFSEKLSPVQWLMGALTAVGVVLAALG